MKYVIGALIGAFGGGLLLAVAGALFGALSPPSCCGVTADRVSGAMIGVMAFGYYFGLPTLAVGSVIGLVTASAWQDQSTPAGSFASLQLPAAQDSWTPPKIEPVQRNSEKGTDYNEHPRR